MWKWIIPLLIWAGQDIFIHFTSASPSNLINALEKSKSNDLYRLINGLGIKHIGVKGAKIIANEFKDLDVIMNLNVNQLINLEEFGETMADSVVEFFKEEKNISVIE